MADRRVLQTRQSKSIGAILIFSNRLVRIPILPLIVLLLISSHQYWLPRATATSLSRDGPVRRIRERTVQFSLEENCPIGTELGTVAFATAKPSIYANRSPQSATSQAVLRYKFGSPSKLFAVDEQGGQLTTISSIDAEALCANAQNHEVASGGGDANRNGAAGIGSQETATATMSTGFVDRVSCTPDGQVTIHLHVNAVLLDGSLRAVHRVTIRVNDLNDNGPQFTQVRWHKRLKEVLYRKGRRLELPKATDADLLAEHSRIHYRLEPTVEQSLKQPNRAGPSLFRLEVSPTGQPGLILTDDLDAETQARHQFVLVAYSPTPVVDQWINRAERSDEGSETSSSVKMESRLQIDIEVADMNDNEPKFDSDAYNVSVAEDTPPGTVIYELIAHDLDSTAQLTYSMGSSTEAAVMQSTFRVETNGRVRLRSFLDYELRHTYKLPVKVSDGEFTAQAHIYVHVLDVNDEPPEFEINPKRLIAEENASAGKLIGRVRIRDPDGELVNGQVRCWEPDNLKDHQVLSFLPDPAVNPTSPVYDLTTRVVLDREHVIQHNPELLSVYLICSDGHGLNVNGMRQSSTMGRQHTATMTASLTIRDDNDHPPVFSKSVYHVSMKENNAIGDKVIQVEASDQDEGDNAKITYSILDRANFKVDSLTGWITAHTVFDRETRDSYQVTVVAMDQGQPRLSSSVLLNLTVLDTNDHRPRLLPCDVTPDNPTDDVTLRAGIQNMWSNEPTSKRLGRLGKCNVFVVEENSAINMHLGEIMAEDLDLGLNARLRFALIPDGLTQFTSRFRLTRNGSLYTAQVLDREEKEHYRLVVHVSDESPTKPLTSTGTISVIVLDVNDNSPIFVQPNGLLPTNVTHQINTLLTPNSGMLYDQPNPANAMYRTDGNVISSPETYGVKPTVQLSMNERPGHLVTALHAKDPDAGVNGQIMYKLQEIMSKPIDSSNFREDVNPLFRMQIDRGDVILRRKMNKRDLGLHFFKVSATDGGRPMPRTATKVLLVQIDNIPAVGGQPMRVLASSYHSTNKSRTNLSLWGFEGRSNMFIITILATVSGLLAFILITAIVCVVAPCSKNRNGWCGRTGRRGTYGSRPITSPGCSEPANGCEFNHRNGTNGSALHYDLIGMNGGHLLYEPPSGGVNPSLLIPEDTWHVQCGNGDCMTGGATFPYHQASNGSAEPYYTNQCERGDSRDTPNWPISSPDPVRSMIPENVRQPTQSATSTPNESMADRNNIRIVHHQRPWELESEQREINSPITLPRCNVMSIPQMETRADCDPTMAASNWHTFSVAKPVPVVPNWNGQIQNTMEEPSRGFSLNRNDNNQRLKMNSARMNPVQHWAGNAVMHEEQEKDSGRGGSEEEETSEGDSRLQNMRIYQSQQCIGPQIPELANLHLEAEMPSRFTTFESGHNPANVTAFNSMRLTEERMRVNTLPSFTTRVAVYNPDNNNNHNIPFGMYDDSTLHSQTGNLR